MNKRTLAVNYTLFQCYLQRQHFIDVPCKLTYVKNVNDYTESFDLCRKSGNLHNLLRRFEVSKYHLFTIYFANN